MRRTNILFLCFLGLGCGARTDAYGDADSNGVAEGGSGTEPQGTGGFTQITSAYPVGGATHVIPPEGGTTWATNLPWGGFSGTVTWWTGQGGWPISGGTSSKGGSTWIGSGGGKPTGGTSSKGGTTWIGTGGTSSKGGRTSTGGTTWIGTGGTTWIGTGGTTWIGTGGAKPTGGASSKGGSSATGGAISSIVSTACTQLAQSTCQKCLCNYCADPVVACATDAGCTKIITCAIETGCIASIMTCFTSCGTVISEAGGTSMSYATAIGTCMIGGGSACGC